MTVVSIGEAKKSLSDLVERVAAGERIEIAIRGRAVVALVPVGKRERGVTFGTLAGRLVIPAHFDAALPNSVVADFDGARR